MDCLASTGSSAPFGVGVIALVLLVVGAVFVATTVRRRGRAASIVLLAVLLAAGLVSGVGTAPAAHAVDCPPSPVAPTATPAPASALAGEWSGPVTGDLVPYDVTVTFTDDGSTASGVVSYSLGCEGTWTQIARTATTVTFRESVQALDCADEGTILITFDETFDSLGYEFYYSTQAFPGTTNIRATLTRLP